MEPCELCGNTGLHIVDGYPECDNGHRLSNTVQTAEDDQDYSRRGRLVRAKKERGKQKILKVYRGKNAYQLYILGWQQILWKQCSTLIHEKGVPNELWSIVRDLWELRLQQLGHRLEDASPEEFDTVAEDTQGETEGLDNDDLEPEVEADTPRRPRRLQTASDSPKLIDTIALNYIGILLLRTPISLETVYRWIRKEDVPFIRAIRYVDEEIKEHMPGEYHEALDTNYIVQILRLQGAIYDLALIYSTSLNMAIPPLNHTHMLHQYIRRLTLPIELIPFANNLNTRILHFSFQYPSSRPLRRTPLSYPEAQLIALLIISVKFLYPFSPTLSAPQSLPPSPLQSSSQISRIQISWPSWLSIHQDPSPSSSYPTSNTNPLLPLTTSSRRGTELSTTSHTTLDMSPTEIDQYMDWYQRTWVSHPSKLDRAEGVDKVIAGLFPLADIGEVSADVKRDDENRELEVVEERVRWGVRMTSVATPVATRIGIRVGENGVLGEGVEEGRGPGPGHGVGYQRFRTEKEVALKGEACRLLHERAAEVACLDVKTLVQAVWEAEGKVLEWQRERRREEVFGDEMDGLDVDRSE